VNPNPLAGATFEKAGSFDCLHEVFVVEKVVEAIGESNVARTRGRVLNGDAIELEIGQARRPCGVFERGGTVKEIGEFRDTRHLPGLDGEIVGFVMGGAGVACEGEREPNFGRERALDGIPLHAFFPGGGLRLVFGPDETAESSQIPDVQGKLGGIVDDQVAGLIVHGVARRPDSDDHMIGLVGHDAVFLSAEAGDHGGKSGTDINECGGPGTAGALIVIEKRGTRKISEGVAEDSTTDAAEIFHQYDGAEALEIEGILFGRGESGDFREAMDTGAVRLARGRRAEIMEQGIDHEGAALRTFSAAEAGQGADVGDGAKGLSLTIRFAEVGGDKIISVEIELEGLRFEQAIGDDALSSFFDEELVQPRLFFAGRGLAAEAVGEHIVAGVTIDPEGAFFVEPVFFAEALGGFIHAAEIDKGAAVVEVDADAEAGDVEVKELQLAADGDGGSEAGDVASVAVSGRLNLHKVAEGDEFLIAFVANESDDLFMWNGRLIEVEVK